MFSNNNICPSLQTARTPSIPASLLAVVSIATSLSMSLAPIGFCQQKPSLRRGADPFLLFIPAHARGRAGGHGTASAPSPTRCARIERRLRSSLPTHNLPKIAAPALWTGSGSPSDHFSRACGPTLNEMNFQRKG